MGAPRGRLAGTATATGGLMWQEVCRLETNNDHDSFTGTILTSAGLISQPAGSNVANPRIVVRALIGGGNKNGGSAIVTQYALAGNPMPFSGTSCIVSVLICPTENADFSSQTGLAELPNEITCEVTGIITIGGSSDAQPTQWLVPIPPLGFQLQVTQGPCRLREVQGFNHGPNLGYLMFFDTEDGGLLVNGAFPLFTIPVGGLPTAPGGDVVFSNDFITSTRVFQYGLFWAVSSTADTLTLDGTGLFRVDIELFSQQQTLSNGQVQ